METRNNCIDNRTLAEFVSVDKLTSETMELITDVTAHIISCKKCREKVAKMQEFYFEKIDYMPQKEAKELLVKELDRIVIELEKPQIEID